MDLRERETDDNQNCLIELKNLVIKKRVFSIFSSVKRKKVH